MERPTKDFYNFLGGFDDGDGFHGISGEERLNEYHLFDKDELLGFGVNIEDVYAADEQHRLETVYYTKISGGTTVIWIRLSPTKILVGVDSRRTDIHLAIYRSGKRDFDKLVSDSEPKFIRFGAVYATLCGNSSRCKSMISFIEKNLELLEMEETKSNIGLLGITYLKSNSIKFEDIESAIVHFCVWNHDTQGYDVILVRDGLESYEEMKEEVFGAGSGSGPGLSTLKSSESLRNARGLMEEMVKAAANDPHTGGLLKVYQLPTDGIYQVDEQPEPILTSSLIEELYGSNKKLYEDLIFNEKTVFVLVLRKEQHIFSRMDLLGYRLKGEVKAKWLCNLDLLVLYVAEFESPGDRIKFLHNCHPAPDYYMLGKFTNMDGDSCDFIMACGSRFNLDRIFNFALKNTEDFKMFI